jgi:ABC-type Fe3+ transport system permease subunit
VRRVFVYVLLYFGALFGVAVVSRVIYDNFSWRQSRANLFEFFRTLAEGETSQVISALTSAPVMAAAGVVVVGLVMLWDSHRRKPRGAPPAENTAPAAAGPGGRSSSTGK